jgi:hypothetical protein
MIFDRILPASETRSLENPDVSLANAAAWNEMFEGSVSTTGVKVSEASALGVPAIAQAIQIVAGTSLVIRAFSAAFSVAMLLTVVSIRWPSATSAPTRCVFSVSKACRLDQRGLALS